MKYVVYKQPLSLDRFFIHEVSASEAAQAKLDNSFVLICLNRFQQIISVLTFQADSEQLKVCTELLFFEDKAQNETAFSIILIKKLLFLEHVDNEIERRTRNVEAHITNDRI